MGTEEGAGEEGAGEEGAGEDGVWRTAPSSAVSSMAETSRMPGG